MYTLEVDLMVEEYADLFLKISPRGSVHVFEIYYNSHPAMSIAHVSKPAKICIDDIILMEHTLYAH